MKPYKFIEGKLYKIKFYDHCIGKSDKMVCEVVGWCTLNEEDFVVITAWQVVTDDMEVKRDNIEPVSLIKSCITSVRKLL
jgi:hypothetical protein